MTETTELVCYVFVHDHLSTVQKGIQAAHVIAELLRASPYNDELRHISEEWATNHKTLLLCRGGNSETLLDIWGTAGRGTMPYATFREDKETLDGMLTAIAIVSPKPAIYTSEEYNTWTEGRKELQRFLFAARLISV